MPEMAKCLHCKESGTCTNGANGLSCARCVAFWQKRKECPADSGQQTGLVCSICWGKGIAEVSSAKWTYRYPAFLASGFILLAFILLFIYGLRENKEHFDKVLVFVSTAIGSITGYYFGGERARATSQKYPSSSKS
jgi:hypothetical protein